MNDAGNVTQYREENVDEKVCTASSLKEDTNRRKDDREDDFDDITTR